ncbi:MAG TPA: diguanylate cyclase [Xanthomonadaceae bacterium]|nr:diguanylate cyclase [Xanthomonadaceae bacterium]
MSLSGGERHDRIAAACLAWLLVLFAMSVLAAVRPVAEPRQVALHALSGSQLSHNGEALLLAGGRDGAASAGLRFDLPAGGGWVLWFDRVPVDALWLERRGWTSVRRDFFAPTQEEGALPAGFLFPLPADWQGDVVLTLRARGNVRAVLHPRLLQATNAGRVGNRALALQAAVYGGLFVIALLAVALYSAARERAFLVLSGGSAIALLAVAAGNGHLYALPLLSAFGAWRGAGLWTLQLLFCTAALQALRRYAALREGSVGGLRWFDLASLLPTALAALCLLDLPGFAAWMPHAVTVVALATGAAGLVLLADALRRRVPMAGALLALVIVAGAAALVRAAMLHGLLPDFLWTRWGYQLALLGAVAVVAIGLISRIGEYRDQRDRDYLARLDSERRMEREAARAALTLALQTELRELSAGDVEHHAFRLLLRHLTPQMPMRVAAVVAYGYHGHDLLLVHPPAQHAAVQDGLPPRTLALRRLAQAGLPLQQPRPAGAQAQVEALLPLPVRAPGWGLLLLLREGSEGFSTEEMALAGEFARLAVLHADEALAALQLRRSAELDALTGAFNRRTTDQWLARSFLDAQRRQQPLSLLFIDVDHFKAINDRIGHPGGDYCLREVAAILRASLDEGDLLGRYGGEEFVVVLPGRAGAQARAVGEHLRAAVERHRFEYEGQLQPLTVSIGVATRLESEGSPDAAVERADKALYAAKHGGRNCVQVAPAVFG